MRLLTLWFIVHRRIEFNIYFFFRLVKKYKLNELIKVVKKKMSYVIDKKKGEIIDVSVIFSFYFYSYNSMHF